MASHTDLTYNDLIQWLRSLTGASKQHRAIGRDGVMVARTRNGELMRHQDPLTVAQFCSDARLLLVQLETPADVA
jgi:hypothetical protein